MAQDKGGKNTRNKMVGGDPGRKRKPTKKKKKKTNGVTRKV